MNETTTHTTYIKNKKMYDHGEHFDAQPFFDNFLWLTTEEAARLLRKSSHALRQLVYKGKVRPRKFAGRLYFKRTELNELIDTSFF